jgi:hypothetical protein
VEDTSLLADMAAGTPTNLLDAANAALIYSRGLLPLC